MYTVVVIALWGLAYCQPNWEEEFLKVPTAANCRQHSQYYTSIPHLAGTPTDQQTAVYTLKALQDAGIPAEIVPYQAMMSYPTQRANVSILSPEGARYTAPLSEDIVPQDPTSDTPWRNLTFNGYAMPGKATGSLVYVNYGTYQDFEDLKALGVDPAGKIAIVRYGQVFRGLKAMNAGAHGMIGMIVYSDPIDDGFVRGPVYPEGPWRPPSGVQRGSMLYLSLCPGDPYKIARPADICGPLGPEDLTPQIPVQPMSYGDAEHFLLHLDQVAPPTSWRGGIANVPYMVTSDTLVVHLETFATFEERTNWNVIATIPKGGLKGYHRDNITTGVGERNPIVKQVMEADDSIVVVGNHRDAWVFGAADPNSGSSSMLEMARGFGVLLKAGWTPSRSLVMGSWDGEEYGLVGSGQWGEQNAAMLTARAVAYLNVDTSATGPNLGMSGSPALVPFLRGATSAVTDPKTGKPLSEVWSGVVGELGSGSDYTVFQHHLGISSTDCGFSGGGGVYHSIYDSFHFMDTFGDPGFEYHKAAAQLWGVMALRLVDARLLPLNYTAYGTSLARFVADTKEKATAAGVHIDFQAIDIVTDRFAGEAAAAEATWRAYEADPDVPRAELDRFNFALMQVERAFLDSQGLPGRVWFKQPIVAPGLETGYAPVVLPGLHQCILEKDEEMCAVQGARLAGHIDNAAIALTAVPPKDKHQRLATSLS